MDCFIGPAIDRRIIWLWSEESDTGKNGMGAYIAATHKHDYLVVNDLNLANILCAYENHKIIHVDLTRNKTEA